MPEFDQLLRDIRRREKDTRPKNQVAVALGYDGGQDPVPKVLASGKGQIAEQIIKIAKEHGIHVHKDATLAEILSVLELDSYIPFEAYVAVAEILSYIYKTNATARNKHKKK